jgi:hypothetical protein
MANVLTSFLVGIGMDTTDYDRGVRDVERGMQGIKVTALGISAAILGVFAGVATAAVNTAQRVDQLSLATQNLNTNKQFVSNLGGAMKLMGGDAAAALTEVRGIEEALTNLQVKGEIGPFAELATAGVDISNLTNKSTAEGFLSELSDQLPNLNNNQRQSVQKSLGLSDATMKALSGGSQQFEALIQRSQDLTGTITQLTDNSRKLSDQMAEFGLRMIGITNELTEKTLPGLIGLSTWANQFVEKHRDDISGVIDTVAENPAATAAVGGGALSATLGALASKLGLTSIGGALTRTGQAGMIAGLSVGAAKFTNEGLSNYLPGYNEISLKFDEMLKDVTGLDEIKSPSELLFGSQHSDIPSWYDKQQLPDQSNYTPDAMPTPYKDVTPASDEANDALVKAIQAAKVNVDNTVNLNVSLDGQAIDARVTAVQERAAYQAIEDLKSTTSR